MSPAAQLDDATLATIDRWLEYRTWHSQVPGAQVAIGLAGEEVFSKAYGFADLEGQVPMRTDHLFRIASHSKTFTSTLVLQLVEQGELGVDDPLGRHLPVVADDPVLGDLRIRELLEHTSGLLRDGLDADYWQFSRPFPDQEQLLALVREGGAKASPGEQYAYSNLGYSLLGLLVEAKTGLPYAQAARTRIVDPLGLPNTAAVYLADRASDYAVGYSGLHQSTERTPLEHIDTAAMDAATGFTSTATDLVRYFTAHRFGDSRLLDDRTKRLQQRRANATDPESAAAGGYGWGLGVEDIDDTRFVGHGGGYPGHITKTLLDPSTGLVVSVLTNAIDGPASNLARGVVQLVQGARRHAEESSGKSEQTAAAAAEALDWTGRYASTWGVLDIALVGGRLLGLDPTEWAPLESVSRLEVVGDGRLKIAAGPGGGSVGEFVTRQVTGGEVQWLRYGGGSLRPFPIPGR
ncbi:MAG: serine hydrolase domain-containing protein [Propionibacteriaceae bacterium]